MTMFDDVLLEDFMDRFYGYGNYQGDYWFIGMEEGGGSSFEDIDKRLKTWKKRGRRELEDVAEYHIEMGITSLFRKRWWAVILKCANVTHSYPVAIAVLRPN